MEGNLKVERVSLKGLREMPREERLLVMRAYYAQNRDKLILRMKAYYDEHKEEAKQRCAEWKDENRDASRAHNRLKAREKLGIVGATDELRFGTCPICETENVKLFCDHDHETKEIRGWICGRCNRALGFFWDSTFVLMRAVEYLVNSWE